MPEVSRFYGIIVRLYFREHPPPHFHALYGEHEAQIEITTGRVLEGDLPNTALRLLEQWRVAHAAELMADWNRARAWQPLQPIAPLE
jgi:hypothetical protein